jgi:hypothetical protein
MSGHRVTLDFVPRRRRVTGAGAALALAGLLAAAFAVNDLLGLDAQRNELAAELDARALASTAHPPSAAQLRAGQEEAAMQRELDLPWSRLLRELEQAGHDSAGSVGLLAVEPDPEKRQVRVTAEARGLAPVLAYVQRLQETTVLRHPALESHEVRTDDPEHPVRVKIVAEWRL